MSSEEQRQNKTELINSLLTKYNNLQLQFSSFAPPVVSPLWIPETIFPSRTKAKLAVSGTAEEPIIGLIDETLNGKELLDCPLHLPIISRLSYVLKQLITKYRLTPYSIPERRGELKSLIINSTADQSQVSLRFVLRSTEAVPRIKKAVKDLLALFPELKVVSVNLQPIPHAILEGEKEIPITENQLIWESYEDLSLAVAPQCFTQVTHQTAKALYRHVAGIFSQRKYVNILDLYCGIGCFSLYISDFVTTCLGIELSSSAIACAKLSATRNAKSNLNFIAADAEKFLTSNLSEKFDAVICNPPRRGLSKAIVEQLCLMKPDCIIYSSCNPETLFRDLSLFAKDYSLKQISPFDMFPLTPHLEVVAELEARG